MTRSGLVEALSQKLRDHSPEDLRIVVNGILEEVGSRLAAGGRVEIRGFGTFEVSHRAPRVARNPRTGEAIRLPARRAPHFKPGKEFRDRVNRTG
jgi:integration host factor subunit beta